MSEDRIFFPYSASINAHPESKTTTDDVEMLQNQLELAQEDLECVHMWLDKQCVPRKLGEQEYSIIGRFQEHIKELEQQSVHWVKCSERLPGVSE